MGSRRACIVEDGRRASINWYKLWLRGVREMNMMGISILGVRGGQQNWQGKRQSLVMRKRSLQKRLARFDGMSEACA